MDGVCPRSELRITGWGGVEGARAGYSVAGLLKDHLSIKQRFTKERARSSTGYWVAFDYHRTNWRGAGPAAEDHVLNRISIRE
jgi:hypothetical protein